MLSPLPIKKLPDTKLNSDWGKCSETLVLNNSTIITMLLVIKCSFSFTCTPHSVDI